MAKKSKAIIELQAKLQEAENKKEHAEILLQYAINGAPVVTKGEWRVLVRRSPRFPDDLYFARIAVFQKTDTWQIWAYGPYMDVVKGISNLCDTTSEVGLTYINVRDLIYQATNEYKAGTKAR